MSSSTSSPEREGAVAAAAGDRHLTMVFGVRVALAIAYPLLAHAASAGHDQLLATCALADIVLIVLLQPLLQPLLQRRRWAWALLAASAMALAWLARSGHALLPLLLVPVAFVALVAWSFGRTLRAPRVPLIGRIVAAIEQQPYPALESELRRYTRGLTLAWTLLLATLALCNLALALLASPGGLLWAAGIAVPLAVSEAQWSWFANISDYGIIGGFMLLEFAWRQRVFPGRHRSFPAFLRQLAGLGPAFWRDLLR